MFNFIRNCQTLVQKGWVVPFYFPDGSERELSCPTYFPTISISVFLILAILMGRRGIVVLICISLVTCEAKCFCLLPDQASHIFLCEVRWRLLPIFFFLIGVIYLSFSY